MFEDTVNTSAYFGLELMEQGYVTLPILLLRFYHRLGLTDLELVVIIHILHLRNREHDYYPSPDKIASLMSADCETVKALVASLMEKKVLSVVAKAQNGSSKSHIYSVHGLFQQLVESWKLHKGDGKQAASNEVAATTDPVLTNAATHLCRVFEREFGRPLSPLELAQLIEWCEGDQYPPGIIVEALKRAVLRGIINLKYVDAILRHWKRQNLRTVPEVLAYEEKYSTRKKQRQQQPYSEPDSPAAQANKFRELYNLS